MDKNSNLKLSAKLLSEQKFYNAGQSTNNIDMIYVHEDVCNELVEEMKMSVFYDHGVLGGVAL